MRERKKERKEGRKEGRKKERKKERNKETKKNAPPETGPLPDRTDRATNRVRGNPSLRRFQMSNELIGPILEVRTFRNNTDSGENLSRQRVAEKFISNGRLPQEHDFA